jgi:hypothetical protein
VADDYHFSRPLEFVSDPADCQMHVRRPLRNSRFSGNEQAGRSLRVPDANLES